MAESKEFEHLGTLKYWQRLEWLSNNNWGRVLKVTDINNENSLTITQSPTMNCQFISIGYIVAALGVNDQRESLKELLNIIRKCMLSKNMILLDVYTGDLKAILDLFASFLENPKPILNTPYRSTNGSDMILLLLYINWDLVAKK